ncbi:MAG: serine hydrolase domain-containing protein [Thermotogota bacterium]
MKRKYIKVIIILIITIVPLVIFSKVFLNNDVKVNQNIEEYTNRFSDKIENIIYDYDIPGLNISLIKNNEIVWMESFGYADLEEKRKMEKDTVFRVESISKSLTTWGIMKLVDEGRIDLDKPIKNYIDDWNFNSSEYDSGKITTRMILSNSAGLNLGKIGPETLFSPYEELPDKRDLIKEEFDIFQEPGKSFYYSDIGFNILDILVEEIIGKTFEKYMKENVLSELDMNNSGYKWNEKWKGNIPNGYDVNGKEIPPYTYAMSGSGNLFSNLEDISKFVIKSMNYDNSFISSKLKKMIHEPVYESIPGYYGLVFDSYSLGHYIDFLGETKSIANGGQGTGWMSQIQFIPETGDGIVILTNSQRSWPAFAYLLNDWAKWTGNDTAGMGLIIIGQIITWIITGLIIYISLSILWSLIEQFIGENKTIKRKSKRSLWLFPLKIIFFTFIFVVVVYLMNMSYQPLYSFFPIASYWLFFSLLGFSVILIISSVYREFYASKIN